MPALLETPPVNTRSSSSFTLLTRLRTRFAEAKWMPAAMSSRARPRARNEMISDSANTVHWLLIAGSDPACREAGPTCLTV